MAKRVPASVRTRESLSVPIEGRLRTLGALFFVGDTSRIDWTHERVLGSIVQVGAGRGETRRAAAPGDPPARRAAPEPAHGRPSDTEA